MTETPKRIQLRRQKGWRKPEGAVVVSRPSRWGNPFSMVDIGLAFPSLTVEQCAQAAVRELCDLIRAGKPITKSVLQADLSRTPVTYTYPSIPEIRHELRGRDLACWCSLYDERGNRFPCHADVLLEIANQGERRGP